MPNKNQKRNLTPLTQRKNSHFLPKTLLPPPPLLTDPPLYPPAPPFVPVVIEFVLILSKGVRPAALTTALLIP